MLSFQGFTPAGRDSQGVEVFPAVYSGMVLEILLALLGGAAAGAALAWVLAAARARARTLGLETEIRVTAERLNAEIASEKQRSAALETERRAAADREAAQNRQLTQIESERASLESSVRHLTESAAQQKAALETASAAQDELRGRNTTLQTQVAAFESDQKNAKEKLESLTAARQEMSNQFETLANRILEEKSKKFSEQNQTSLGNLMAPIKEKFGEFQQKVESLEKDGIAGRSELKTEIAQLRTLNERLSQEANNLASALKGSSKTQGDWGEYVLESILDAAGLRKGYEYRVQESFAQGDDADRGRARLDVILDLPGKRHLILDSKVSLNQYSIYCNSEDGDERAAALKLHLSSMRKHIRDLSERNYQKLYDINTPDFVVMFVPIEPAFMLAISQESTLWQDAWDKNILLVSPSTLLFVLRTVSHLWRQELQAKSIREIVKKGGALYDKLAGVLEDLTMVGDRLGKAQEAYENAYKKLALGQNNALQQAEAFKKLGVKPTKSLAKALPPRIAELADLDAEPVQAELLELAAAEENEAEQS